MENWKPIPGYEGIYSVSDVGNVRSEPRLVAHIRAGKSLKGKLLTPRVSPVGYLAVNLSKENVKKTFTVHRLVALAFLGARPDGMEVAHWNGDRLDPRLDNLRYATVAENLADRARHGTVLRGSQLKHSKLTEDLARAIRVDPRPLAEVSAAYAVSQTTIHNIRAGKAWLHA